MVSPAAPGAGTRERSGPTGTKCAPRTQLGVGRTETEPAAGGDRSGAIAFGHLFRAHAQAVYAFCARRTGDLSAAEDSTSVTFLEA